MLAFLEETKNKIQITEVYLSQWNQQKQCD